MPERNSTLECTNTPRAVVRHDETEPPRRVEELYRCGQLQDGGPRRADLRDRIPGIEGLTAFRWTVAG